MIMPQPNPVSPILAMASQPTQAQTSEAATQNLMSASPFSPILSPQYQADLFVAQAAAPMMMSGVIA